MSGIEVTENKDLSFTIRGIEPDEMTHLFRKGLKSMIEDVSDGDRFVVLDPESVGTKIITKTHEIDDDDYDKIVQVGITKILMEYLEKAIHHDWSSDGNEAD